MGVQSPAYPIASSLSRRAVPAPSDADLARLDEILRTVTAAGIRVDGLDLARALVESRQLDRLERLVGNRRAIGILSGSVRRIEFIAEGPLPAELLVEPPLKRQPVFRQTVDYGLCKGCRLCIQVCPKHVYRDDGFGKPDVARREAECTGGEQCGWCVDICPERSITVTMADDVWTSTLFVLLDNPFARAEADIVETPDFAVVNPLRTAAWRRAPALDPADLRASNAALDRANIHPTLELRGAERHFVDSRDPVADLATWARENGRSVELTLAAMRLTYPRLARLGDLREGKYRLGSIIHRVIDEILHAGIAVESPEALGLLADIVGEAFVDEPFLGAKRRPIGGLLPPGTSTAWKTPYGNEIPSYARLGRCLGPECALCITHCPEGGGGERSAIRMVPLAPLGVIPALVRGTRVFVLRLDGSDQATEDIEELTGKEAFTFEVDPDFCKSCGLCIACCPHDVIDGVRRSFDVGASV